MCFLVPIAFAIDSFSYQHSGETLISQEVLAQSISQGTIESLEEYIEKDIAEAEKKEADQNTRTEAEEERFEELEERKIEGKLTDPKERKEWANLKGKSKNSEAAFCFDLWDGYFDFGECANLGVSWISLLWLRLLGWLVWLAGGFLDFVMKTTVFTVGSYFQEGQGIGKAINSVWSYFRDIANILFIFALLYISILTILQLAGDKTKTVLRNVVIVALLINFSLFFTKVIFDSSNYLSYQLYEYTQCSDNPVDLGTEGFEGENLKSTGKISNCFMQPLGLTTLYSTKNGSAGSAEALARKGFWNIMVVGMMGTVLFLVASFIFFSAAILFIRRFVVILFLMILSPLAFAFHILPDTKKHAKAWWDKLLHESFFAPLYILLMGASIKIIHGVGESLNIEGSGASFGELAEKGGQGDGPMALLLNFVIATGFLIASLFIANKLGADGASGMVKLSGKARKFAAKRGGTVARGTVGKSARWADDKFAKTSIGNSRAGRALRSVTTQGVAKMKMGGKTAEQARKDRDKQAEDISKKAREISVSNVEKKEKKLIKKQQQAKTGFEKVKDTDKVIEAREEIKKHNQDIQNYKQQISEQETIENDQNATPEQKREAQRIRLKIQGDMQIAEGLAKKAKDEIKDTVQPEIKKYEDKIRKEKGNVERAKQKELNRFQETQQKSGRLTLATQWTKDFWGGMGKENREELRENIRKDLAKSYRKRQSDKKNKKKQDKSDKDLLDKLRKVMKEDGGDSKGGSDKKDDQNKNE